MIYITVDHKEDNIRVLTLTLQEPEGIEGGDRIHLIVDAIWDDAVGYLTQLGLDICGYNFQQHIVKVRETDRVPAERRIVIRESLPAVDFSGEADGATESKVNDG